MRCRTVFLGLVVLLLLVGCTKDKTKKLEIQPFIGGTSGLLIDFVDLRKEVFDGGRDPFDVVVKLENKGETLIPKNKVRVKLTGVRPEEFGKTEEQFILSPPEDVFDNRKDVQGNVQPSTPVFVEFRELNHFTKITGSALSFPVRAEICYRYGSRAISKLCVRENLVAPKAGGICEINEAKPTFSSGAPLQVANVQESTRAKNKISFSFELQNSGTGLVYERDTNCDKSTRKNENRVFVSADTKAQGLSCTGLTNRGTAAEGFVTLFEGKKTVTCTQDIARPSDYELLLSVETVYDYEEFKQTDITVKSSGE